MKARISYVGTGVVAAAALAFSSLVSGQTTGQSTGQTRSVQASKQGQDSRTADKGAQPLTFDTMSHDFGTISDMDKVTHLFKFENTSDRTVTITRVKAQCGCTTPVLGKKVYQPGETGEIEVTFDPTGRRNQQNKTVTISTTDPKWPRITVGFTSVVKPLAWMEPLAGKVFFREIQEGQGASDFVNLLTRVPDLKLVEIENVEGVLKAQVVREEEIDIDGEKVRQYVLNISLAKDAPIGFHSASINLVTTDERIKQRVNASATVVGDVRATPPRIAIRERKPNTPFEAEVRLDSRSNKPLKIEGWNVVNGENLQAVIDAEPITEGRDKGGFILRMFGQTPSQNGPHRGSVLVKVRTGDKVENIEIKFYGTVRDPNARRAAVNRSNVAPSTTGLVPGIPKQRKPDDAGQPSMGDKKDAGQPSTDPKKDDG